MVLLQAVTSNATVGSVQGITSTVRGPRVPITRTQPPLGSGSSDQARQLSMPPPTFRATSPAPLVPRVATVTAPTRPLPAGSPTPAVLCSALSGRPLKARHHCDSQRRTPGRRRRKPWSAVAVASRFPTALESSRYLVGQRGV